MSTEYGFRTRPGRIHVLTLAAAAMLGTGLSAQIPEPAAASAVTRFGTVTANVLNVRAKPGTYYEIVAKIRKNTRVEIVEATESWLRIRVPGDAKAWIAMSFLNNDGVVTGDRVRIHSGPGLVFSTFAYANKGDEVTPAGAPVEGWQRIKAPPTATAWVSSAFVELEPEPEPELEPAETEPEPEPEPAETEPEPEPEPEPDVEVEPAPKPEPEPVAEVEPEPVPAPVPLEPKPAPPALEPEPEPAPEPAPEPDAEPEPAPAPTDVVTLDGILLPLPDTERQLATHVLGVRIRNTCYPVCYLRSSRVNLSDWEMRDVRIRGRGRRFRDWKHPLVEVTGIQITPAP